MTALIPEYAKYNNVFFRSSEFRRNIRDNTFIGLSISIGISGLMCLLFLFGRNGVVPELINQDGPYPNIGPGIDFFYPADPKQPVVSNAATNLRVGVTAKLSTSLKAIADNDPKAAGINIANIGDAPRSGADIEGTLPDNPTIYRSVLAPPAPVPEPVAVDEPFESFAVDVQPVVDLALIQSKVIYPRIAIAAGVEGKVGLRVLIGADGRPRKAEIDYFDSEMLKNAALNAVMSVSYQPAVRNGSKVDCWISFPIVFRLKNN